jgi:hypothetical protein
MSSRAYHGWKRWAFGTLMRFDEREDWQEFCSPNVEIN